MSMSNLFIDLYRYRQREQKNNLEDWLTECLAAILRSLDEKQWGHFLREVTQILDHAIDDFLARGLPQVRTQVVAGEGFGIPDLVIEQHGRPAILFENKVAHHVAIATDDDGVTRNQLHRYAEWLNLNADQHSNVRHMVFLTHLTQPPHDFRAVELVETCPYRGIDRSVHTWGDLGRVLLDITGSIGDVSLAGGLAEAFYAMLEDEGMSNEFADTTAIASLQVFLAQGSGIENLLDRMWGEIKRVGNSSNRERERIEPEFEYGRYSVWRYVNRINSVDTGTAFLMTGLWFPEIAETWSSEDLGGHSAQGPQVFLQFGDDHDDVFADVAGAPSEAWHRPASDFLRLKPLHEFPGSPDERAASILSWLAYEGEILREFLLKQALAS